MLSSASKLIFIFPFSIDTFKKKDNSRKIIANVMSISLVDVRGKYPWMYGYMLKKCMNVPGIHLPYRHMLENCMDVQEIRHLNVRWYISTKCVGVYDGKNPAGMEVK